MRLRPQLETYVEILSHVNVLVGTQEKTVTELKNWTHQHMKGIGRYGKRQYHSGNEHR